MFSSSWQGSVPLSITSPRCALGFSLQSGLRTGVCAPCSRTNEILLWPSSPGWSITLQQRGTRQRSVKVENGLKLGVL